MENEIPNKNFLIIGNNFKLYFDAVNKSVYLHSNNQVMKICFILAQY